jgi:hypothetical protein
VLNKIKIVLLLFCVLLLPTGPAPWQVAQDNFPTGLSQSVCLIRNSIGQIDSKFSEINGLLVEDAGETLDVVSIAF